MADSLSGFLDGSVAVLDAMEALQQAYWPHAERAPGWGSWSEIEPHFEALGTALVEIHQQAKEPPKGGGAVADWLGQVKQHTLLLKQYIDIQGGQAAIGNDHNSLCWLVRDGILTSTVIGKARQKSRDPFSELSADGTLSLLERFPATTAGYIEFLEWVCLEVKEQADALRAGKYTHQIIAKQLKFGVKWVEAGQRISMLSDLPVDAVEQVARILRRELTIGAVEQIDELLTPAVRTLRDAWENRDLAEGEASGGEQAKQSVGRSSQLEQGQLADSQASSRRVNSEPVETNDAAELESDEIPVAPVGGFLGGQELLAALGIHSTRAIAFLQQLGRKRKNLGDSNWQEVTEPSPNSPKYLYRSDTIEILNLAKPYKSPKSD